MRLHDGLLLCLRFWSSQECRLEAIFIHTPTTKCCSVQINNSFYISKRLYNKLFFITRDVPSIVGLYLAFERFEIWGICRNNKSFFFFGGECHAKYAKDLCKIEHFRTVRVIVGGFSKVGFFIRLYESEFLLLGSLSSSCASCENSKAWTTMNSRSICKKIIFSVSLSSF